MDENSPTFYGPQFQKKKSRENSCQVNFSSSTGTFKRHACHLRKPRDFPRKHVFEQALLV